MLLNPRSALITSPLPLLASAPAQQMAIQSKVRRTAIHNYRLLTKRKACGAPFPALLVVCLCQDYDVGHLSLTMRFPIELTIRAQI